MRLNIKNSILLILRKLKILDRVPLGLRIVNFIFQRFFRVNSKLKIPMHFTSNISVARKVYFSKDINTMASFATSGNCYIQGYNGVYLGRNILFAKGLNLISANHNHKNLNRWDETKSIYIGDNVWIGANVTILPSVTIGNNCIIGAGSVVTKSFKDDNLVIAGNPARIIRKKA